MLSFHGLSEGAEIHTLTSEMGELGLTEGFTTTEIHASDAAWEMFQRHQLPA